MLSTLITSKSSVCLLFKFFLNSTKRPYLVQLTNKLKEIIKSVRVRINLLIGEVGLGTYAERNLMIYQTKTYYLSFLKIKKIVSKIIIIDEKHIRKSYFLYDIYFLVDCIKEIDLGKGRLYV